MIKETVKENSEVLSTNEYWDSVLEGVKLPRVNHPKDYFITMDFIDGVLANEKKKSFLEVGAGSSGWLPYFAQKYGYIVSGLDYSDIGCKIAKENLRILNIKYDEIICEDIFKWNSSKKYDVIFSYGVVEHFEEPRKLIKICHDHLNDNGIIITLVPNLCGLMGAWSKRFVPDIYEMHKVISCNELKQMHLANGFTDITTQYVGTLSLGVIPWIRSNHLLFRNNSFQRKMSLFSIAVLNKIISTFLKLTHLRLPSRYFSPYIISIMRKP